MTGKEKLFIYGTLINLNIQESVFGRQDKGLPDVLKGYKKSEIRIEDEFFQIIFPDNMEVVDGFVINVTKDELKKIDEYETDAYKRERVVLESGISAWVYH